MYCCFTGIFKNCQCKYYNMQNLGFVWVLKLVSQINGRTEVEGVREQGAEKDTLGVRGRG